MTADILRQPPTPLVAPGGMELLQRDMTAIFAADVTLATAQSRLAEIRQWLPIDGDPQSTLGDWPRNAICRIRNAIPPWK